MHIRRRIAYRDIDTSTYRLQSCHWSWRGWMQPQRMHSSFMQEWCGMFTSWSIIQVICKKLYTSKRDKKKELKSILSKSYVYTYLTFSCICTKEWVGPDCSIPVWFTTRRNLPDAYGEFSPLLISVTKIIDQHWCYNIILEWTRCTYKFYIYWRNSSLII